LAASDGALWFDLSSQKLSFNKYVFSPPPALCAVDDGLIEAVEGDGEALLVGPSVP